MSFELVEADAPQHAIGLEPFVELHQRFGTYPIHATPAVGAHLDQPGLAQHPKMLRHRGLAEGETLHQRVHRPHTVAQQIQDLPARRFGEHFDRCAGGHAVLGAYTNDAGATVITSGSTDWAHGLAARDPHIEQITRNVLSRLG